MKAHCFQTVSLCVPPDCERAAAAFTKELIVCFRVESVSILFKSFLEVFCLTRWGFSASCLCFLPMSLLAFVFSDHFSMSVSSLAPCSLHAGGLKIRIGRVET